MFYAGNATAMVLTCSNAFHAGGKKRLAIQADKTA